MQGIDLYLDRRKIDIRQGDMLPELSVGEHKLRLDINNKTLDEVTFNVTEAEYMFRFKFSYLKGDYYQDVRSIIPSACLPKKGIQTRLTKQDDSEWKDFLPNIFTMSKEWNALATSWQEGRKTLYDTPPCISNMDKAHTNEVFIDFYIKANKSKHLSKPIWINFESRRGSLGRRAGLLIRSISEMREILGISGSIPRSYRIDFSKKSILTLNGFRATPTVSGCGLVPIYDNLTAIYEWNNKLYVMTKAVTEEIVYPAGICDLLTSGFSNILILDYAKDLPLEFIEIP